MTSLPSRFLMPTLEEYPRINVAVCQRKRHAATFVLPRRRTNMCFTMLKMCEAKHENAHVMEFCVSFSCFLQKVPPVCSALFRGRFAGEQSRWYAVSMSCDCREVKFMNSYN